MLSRIAESLYWIGRYVERAEDTARILDVHIQHLLEAPTADIASTCRVLLDAMGTDPPDGPLDARRVTELLGLEPANPSSIVASLGAARNNARGVSEAISSEIWEALNSTYNALPARWVSPAAVACTPSSASSGNARRSWPARPTRRWAGTTRGGSWCSAGAWSAPTWSPDCSPPASRRSTPATSTGSCSYVPAPPARLSSGPTPGAGPAAGRRAARARPALP